MSELQGYVESTLKYLEEHKKTRMIVGLLLVLACCSAAFEFGTHIGEFAYVLIH
ncbi:hypothetical protein SAMN06297422_1387 [Lachnospiraceae bacterium]|nr:hypothetical protein SAMN06297422_1387 [Lachnospiraceae bacterium]